MKPAIIPIITMDDVKSVIPEDIFNLIDSVNKDADTRSIIISEKRKDVTNKFIHIMETENNFQQKDLFDKVYSSSVLTYLINIFTPFFTKEVSDFLSGLTTCIKDVIIQSGRAASCKVKIQAYREFMSDRCARFFEAEVIKRRRSAVKTIDLYSKLYNNPEFVKFIFTTFFSSEMDIAKWVYDILKDGTITDEPVLNEINDEH